MYFLSRIMSFWCVFAACLFASGAAQTLHISDSKSLDEFKQLLQHHTAPETFTELLVENSALLELDANVLERFASLEDACFKQNEIQRVQNDAFNGLHALRTLTLSNNGIETLGDAFHALALLETLDISNNLIEHLNQRLFQNLKRLKHVRASNNVLNHLDSEVLNHFYTSAPSFDFSNNKLETLPSGLFTNVSVSDVYFTHNALKNVETAAYKNARFRSLHFEYNALASINPDAFEDVAVNELRLTGNRIVLQPRNFKNLRELESLFLDSNEISVIPAGCFEGLALVNTLSLRDNNLTWLESSMFDGLSNLRTLFAGFNPIKRVTQAFPASLAYVHLDGCMIDAIEDDAFGNAHFRVLNLGKNRLTSIPRLPPAKNLYLDHNLIEVVPNAAFSHDNFTYLLLHGNRISGIEPHAFKGVAQVYNLQLQRNQLKRLPKDVFKHLAYVKTVNLEDNLLEDVQVLQELPTCPVALLGGNYELEKRNLPLNELGIQNVDFIGFKNFSYARVDGVWRFVDKPVEL